MNIFILTQKGDVESCPLFLLFHRIKISQVAQGLQLEISELTDV